MVLVGGKYAMCGPCRDLTQAVAQLRFDVGVARLYNAEAPATHRGEIAPTRKRVADGLARRDVHVPEPWLAAQVTLPAEWRLPQGPGRLTLTVTDHEHLQQYFQDFWTGLKHLHPLHVGDLVQHIEGFDPRVGRALEEFFHPRRYQRRVITWSAACGVLARLIDVEPEQLRELLKERHNQPRATEPPARVAAPAPTGADADPPHTADSRGLD